MGQRIYILRGEDINCLSLQVNPSLASLSIPEDTPRVNGNSYARVLTRNSQTPISFPRNTEENIKTSSNYLWDSNQQIEVNQNNDDELKVSQEDELKVSQENEVKENELVSNSHNELEDDRDEIKDAKAVKSDVVAFRVVRKDEGLEEDNQLSTSQPTLVINDSEVEGVEDSQLFNNQIPFVEEGKNINALRKRLMENSLVEGEINSLDANSLIIAQENNTSEENKPLFSISNDGLSLQETLFRWQQINSASQQTETQRQQANIPPLQDLEGRLTGKINLIASVRDGIDASFDFRGDDWYWGKYQADTIQARGSFRDGLLTLLPVSLQDDETIVSLSGTFSQERFSGQVLVTDLPIKNLAGVANLPPNFDIEGIANGNIVISGNVENPVATGNVEIVDAKINGTTIEETNANLGYRNSRLDFLATSNLTGEEESARLLGSFPFRLFPQSSNSGSDDFRLNLNIEESGFGLLTVISNNQFNLTKGSGGVDLNISGRYNQSENTILDFVADGLATISDGEMEVAFIPDTPITDINGDILFDFDQITIPSLTGNFSEGEIIIVGGLPLFREDSEGDILTASVENLALNLPNLYEGNGKGYIEIAGSAIAPIIGGNITLFDGDVFLAGGQNGNGNDYVMGAGNNPLISNTTINSLNLILGDNITVTQAPVLNLNAKGSLSLNGDINNLQPEGVINLTGGQCQFIYQSIKTQPQL